MDEHLAFTSISNGKFESITNQLPTYFQTFYKTFQAIAILIWNFGFKKSFKFLAKWPCYALLPTFTPFIFSATLIKDRKYLIFSFNWSWFNLIFSALGIIGGPFVHYAVADSLTDVHLSELPFDKVADYFWSASLVPCLLYLGCFVSFTLLTKVQNGKIIKRTAFHLETFEQIQVDLDEPETSNVACQISTSKPEEVKDENETVIRVWKEVARQTESPKSLKKKATELISMVEFIEVLN